jgi:type IV pilus assembly protein PilA
MLDKLRKRLRSEKGFTLIELLVVMIILAILTAIAIPSYLSFKDRANKSAAGADVRSIIPSIESYFSDNGTYSGMTVSNLKTNYDQAINLSTYTLGTGLSSTHYCVKAVSQNQSAAKNGPSAAIVIGGTCT